MKKIIYFFLALFFLLSVPLLYIASHPADGVLILEYHQITDHPRPGADLYTISTKEFSDQLDYLQSEGYETITMHDYAKAMKGMKELPAKCVVLTFDDGYDNVYTEAIPRLKERGMTGVVYVVANYANKEKYMTWKEIADLDASGIEIGSHTANHLPLTDLSAEAQLDEIRLSKLLIEWNALKHSIHSFSYPNGKYTPELFDMLREEDYYTAVTGDAGKNTLDMNPYTLKRVVISPSPFGLFTFRLRLLRADVFTYLGI
ncbi:hypothetical protein TAMA11512_00310 [Selenomonas sp. TAMA-11512]|uniref:polysaccharide deacetylase family protein n=1 Tax=Selenomonas sp. TAMA-11512 TaxID=3095337 RepID=UPI00308FAE5B|nr:hypothetical protein TAMA11512_00310 [Selenomonas sp. TAMA-11512]